MSDCRPPLNQTPVAVRRGAQNASLSATSRERVCRTETVPRSRARQLSAICSPSARTSGSSESEAVGTTMSDPLAPTHEANAWRSSSGRGPPPQRKRVPLRPVGGSGSAPAMVSPAPAVSGVEGDSCATATGRLAPTASRPASQISSGQSGTSRGRTERPRVRRARSPRLKPWAVALRPRGTPSHRHRGSDCEDCPAQTTSPLDPTHEPAANRVMSASCAWQTTPRDPTPDLARNTPRRSLRACEARKTNNDCRP